MSAYSSRRSHCPTGTQKQNLVYNCRVGPARMGRAELAEKGTQFIRHLVASVTLLVSFCSVLPPDC